MFSKQNISYLFFNSIFLILLTFTLISCSEDPPTISENNSTASKIFEEISNPQEENYNLYEKLTQSMTSSAAMDSVLKVFLLDPLVEWGEVDKQGIAIKYRNGIRGGIFIDPLDFPEDSSFNFTNLLKTTNKQSPTKTFSPGSKKTIFLNPSYWERKRYADILINNYKKYLKNVGFDQPVVYKNENATIDQFTNLSDYGIIHIYSHGWAWPKSNNIEQIYLLTGDTLAINTFEKYFDEILDGDISVVYSKKKKKNVLLITPDFIAMHNNFEVNKPLFYGGFCFSNLGNWPEIIVNTAQAGGYFGFNWSVRTAKNAHWNYKLIQSLTDTGNTITNSVDTWMKNSLDKSYFDAKQNKNIKINYTGNNDFSLIESSEQESLFNVCDISIQYLGYYFNIEDSNYQSIEIKYFTSNKLSGSFSGNVFNGNYGDQNNENILIELSDDQSKIINLTWNRSYSDTNWGIVSDKILINASNIPLDASYTPPFFDGRYIKLGEEVCASLVKITHERVTENSPNNWSHNLDYFECDVNAILKIRFLKE